MTNQTELEKELKMAEIEHLKAQTARIQMETEQLRATTLKLQAEAQKIQKETKLYPYVVAGGLGGLVGAIISLLVKAI